MKSFRTLVLLAVFALCGAAHAQELSIIAPSSAVSDYPVGAASFGAALTPSGTTGELAQVVDQADGKTGYACTPLSATNVAAVTGKVALIDAGSCADASMKALNVQNAGAIAVIIVEAAQAAAPSPITGTNPAVTVPVVSLRFDDGVLLKNALGKRTRTRTAGLIGTLHSD